MEENSINNMQPIKTTPPKKAKKAKIAIIILAIFLAGALAFSAYAWMQNDTLSKDLSENKDKNSDLTQKNVDLQDQLTQAQKERDELAKEDKKPAEAPVPSDQEAVTTAAKNFADAATTDSSVTNEISQVKINGNFADAVVSSPGQGGFGVTLKKVNGAWVVIADGQNGPDEDTVKRFGIPR